jgi:hypothetical protein
MVRRELREAAERKGFGQVVRIHRRGPRWRLVPPVALLLLMLGLIPGFVAFTLAMTGSAWWRLVALGFALLCAVVLFRVFVRPGLRDEQWVVAEGGLLCWEPRRHRVIESYEWPELPRSGRIPRLPDAGLIDHRELVAAVLSRQPIGPWTRRRMVRVSATTAVVLAFLVPLTWFCAVPIGARILLGEAPDDVLAMGRICTGGDPYPRGAAYRGPAPHPIAVVDNNSVVDVLGAASPPGGWPSGRIVQLAACGNDVLRPDRKQVQNCNYYGGFSVTYYQGHYEYKIRDVRTGRVVGTVTAEGVDKAKCAETWYAERGSGAISIATSPDDQQIAKVLNRYLTGSPVRR